MKVQLPASVGFGAGLGAIALVGVGVVAYLLYKNREKFDPTSDKNLAYQGANKIVQAITGDKNQTVGGAGFDLVDSVKQFFGAKPAGLADDNEELVNGRIVTRPKPASSPASYNDWLEYQSQTGIGLGA